MTSAIVNKMLHQPTARLRAVQAGGQRAGRRRRRAVRAGRHAPEGRRGLMLRIATRKSPLALWQARHVAGLLRARVAGDRGDAGRALHRGRPDAGQPAVAHRRQGAVREGDRGGAARRPGRPRRAQPEGRDQHLPAGAGAGGGAGARGPSRRVGEPARAPLRGDSPRRPGRDLVASPGLSAPGAAPRRGGGPAPGERGHAAAEDRGAGPRRLHPRPRRACAAWSWSSG